MVLSEKATSFVQLSDESHIAYGFREKYSIELAATEVIKRVIKIFNLIFYADDTALMSTRTPFNSRGKIL